MATNGPSDLGPEPTPTPAPAPPPPADSGGGLFNLGRGAKGVALLCFLLPWITISCAGQELATMSGLDLARGTISFSSNMPGGMAAPASSQGGDLPVMLAGILIVAALVLTFVLRRQLAALVAMTLCALAAAAISYTAFVKVPNSTNESAAAPGGGGDAAAMGMNQQQLAEMIQINYGIGLWLTLGALIAAIVLNFLARGKASP